MAALLDEFQTGLTSTLPSASLDLCGLGRKVVNATMNPLERFNREMNQAVPVEHPNMILFVTTIERLARCQVQLRQDVLIGLAETPARLEVHLPAAIDFSSLADLRLEEGDCEDENGYTGLEDSMSDRDSNSFDAESQSGDDTEGVEGDSEDD